MLFTTNFLAILLAGGVTFMLTGLGRLAATGDRLRRNAFMLIALATLLVAIPLTITTYSVVGHALENRAAIEGVDAWLDGTTHNVVLVDVCDNIVVATIDGYGNLHPLRDLANQLAARLKRPVAVNLRLLPTQAAASGETAP
jgi:hypothetical protein